jgi:hypothetical protein
MLKSVRMQDIFGKAIHVNFLNALPKRTARKSPEQGFFFGTIGTF